MIVSRLILAYDSKREYATREHILPGPTELPHPPEDDDQDEDWEFNLFPFRDSILIFVIFRNVHADLSCISYVLITWLLACLQISDNVPRISL